MSASSWCDSQLQFSLPEHPSSSLTWGGTLSICPQRRVQQVTFKGFLKLSWHLQVKNMMIIVNAAVWYIWKWLREYILKALITRKNFSSFVSYLREMMDPN